MMSWLWLAVPLTPLLLAVPALRWPQRAGSWLWLSCLPAAVAVALVPDNLQLEALWPAAQWGSPDLPGRSWLGFSALLWAAASIYAGSALTDRRPRFWLFWQLSLAGNLLLLVAADGISFFVGFSVMSLAAYGLVVHTGEPEARRAGRVYLQLAILAEMLLFAGLVWRIHETGGIIDFARWETAAIGSVTAVLLLLGFGLKAGFWPLHVWLPLAHPAAPAAASAVLSGAMIKAGILGLWRFFPAAGPDQLLYWQEVLLAVAVISALFGVAMGLVQSKAKTALAYSSISQMGYLLAVLALAWADPGNRVWWGLLLAAYGVHHGLTKGALFMGAGLASHYRLGTYSWALMALAALALAGLPASSGALVKLLLKEGVASSAWHASSWLLTLGSLTTALLVLRALWLMMVRPGGGAPPAARRYPWLLLSLAPLALPWLWPDSRAWLFASVGWSKLWSLCWPLLLALAITLTALKLGWRWPERWRSHSSPLPLLSLRLKQGLQRRPFNSPGLSFDHQAWRRRERLWNRFWQQGNITISAWLLGGLLLLAWLL